jgi:hypothetical protein
MKSSRVSEFRESCQKKFPLATVFLPKEQLATLKAQLHAITNGVAEATDEKPGNGDALLIEPSGEQ